MMASPEPHTAYMRRRGYGTTTTLGLTITGRSMGPLFSGGFALAVGASGTGATEGAGFGAGAGVEGSDVNLSGKSETSSLLSEIFAFSWKEASSGSSKLTSPDIVVKP